MRGSRFLPALAASSLLIAACGGGSTNDGTAATPKPAAETSLASDVPAIDVAAAGPAPADTAAAGDVVAAPGDVVAAPAALQFTAPLVGGGELDAATLAGKPTLFWFWAPT
ncbi:hypothetical protein [Ilumatobacter sp.]|uniref:hypothetical protein n=1 Tax=Ilumatobacter sp. TaxID=1967498 RepID=UPI0037515E68